MAQILLSPITLVNLASAPVTASAGDTYFDTVLLTARTFNGTVWVSVPTSSSGGGTPFARNMMMALL